MNPDAAPWPFHVKGTSCAGWHLRASDSALSGPEGRPCIVMAHGFGATTDTGLDSFIDAFVAAGIDVFAFDYRYLGASCGSPRQKVSYRAQRRDWSTALNVATGLPGVDPTRIALWGTSYSGGHVLHLAARDPRPRAVVAMTPAVDGLAAVVHTARTVGWSMLGRMIAHGILDATLAPWGRAHTIALAAEPGDVAFMTGPGDLAAYTSIAGPTWRNEVAAREALMMPTNRPITRAARISCPVLVQIATRDHLAPPASATRAAKKAPRAEPRYYDADHFDVYDNGSAHTAVLTDQLTFLHTHLATPTSSHGRPGEPHSERAST